MTKPPRKNVPDIGIELGAACMRSGHASDRAAAPGIFTKRKKTNIATENQFLYFELHGFYSDILSLKNAEIRSFCLILQQIWILRS